MKAKERRRWRIYRFSKRTGKRLDEVLKSSYSFNIVSISSKPLSTYPLLMSKDKVFEVVGYLFMDKLDEGYEDGKERKKSIKANVLYLAS